jgi:hypothetical protein
MNGEPAIRHGVSQTIRPALVSGIIVWLVLTVATAALCKPWWEVVARYWTLHFLGGGVVTFLVAAVAIVRGRATGRDLLAVMAAFLLPASLLLVGWQAICSIYTDPARDAALHDSAPVIMLLTYALGLIFGWRMVVKRREQDFIVAAALPPAIMALVSLACFGAGTFTSDGYRYHDAFLFGVQKTNFDGQVLRANCLLTLRRGGSYSYSASPLTEDLVENGGAPPEITWAGGQGAPTAPGDYVVTLTWRNVQARAPGPRVFELPTAPYFGISIGSDSAKRLIMSFPVPLDTPLASPPPGVVP